MLDDLAKNKLTVNNIIRTVRDFIVYLEDKSLELNTKSIKRYLDYIQDSFKESSFITKVSAVRQFTNWLNIENNPFLDKDFIFNRTEIDYLTDEEFEGLFGSENFDYHEMILRCFYELHMSLEEFRAMTLKDFNQANSSFKLRSCKISCSDRLKELCREYLNSQRQEILRQAYYSPQLDEAFFIKELSVKSKSNEFNNMELSEIIRSFDLSLNKLKRSRIINLIKRGLSDEEIHELLGVKISAFYDQFKPRQSYRLLNAYADFHPRSKL